VCSDYNECVLEITNLEKKKKKKKKVMMTTNPLMHRQGGREYQCGWFRVGDACNTRQFCRETLRVFEKKTIKSEKSKNCPF
jgi:hypothetical protein